ncbi:hypothetical protein RQN30_01090 [Arcanobacterium hippocoleae]
MIIGLSMNPVSGKGRAEKYRREILRILASYKADVHELIANNAQERLAAIRKAVTKKKLMP